MSTLNEIFGEVKPKSKNSSSKMTILFGKNGSGKTTLASTCSEIGETLLINFENRVACINESDTLRILPRSEGEFRQDKKMSYQNFLKFVTFVETKYQPNYIILDTLDAMFDTFLKGMLASGEISDAFYGRSAVYDKIFVCLNRLKDTGVNLILTSQCLKSETFGVVDVAVVEKLANKINPITDNKFFLKATDDDNRVLCLKANNQLECKLSVEKDVYNSVPKDLQNPSWKDVEEACGW